MKISKTVQRRTIILASIAALIALFHIAHYTVQLIYSTNPYRGIDNHTYIGELDTSFRAYDIKEVYEEYAAKVEIIVTANGRDESEALYKIEDILNRAQFIWDHDILDIKKED